MKLTFRMYAAASVVSFLGLVAFALIVNDEFYSTLRFLSNARICTAMMYNLLFMLSFWLIRMTVWLFLGRLRELEIEQVCDAGSGFLMDTIMFLVLTSPTVNGVEASILVIFKNVGFVVILKAFHLICQTRVVHVFESGIPRLSALASLFCLMAILLLQDVLLTVHFFNAIRGNSSLFLWLLFEFLGMSVTAFSFIGKLALSYIDLQMENGWPGKTAALFILDLVGDVLSLLTVLVFLCLFIFKYPSQLPIHMTANIIQVVRTLTLKVRSFQRCRVLVNEMSKRFPEATFEELENADTCIICRDLLYEGARKLPCDHIYHIDCLKAWFVQQQTCPTCRADVLMVTRTSPSPTEPEQAGQQRPASGVVGSGVTDTSCPNSADITNNSSPTSQAGGAAKQGEPTEEEQPGVVTRMLNYVAPSLMGSNSATEDMRWHEKSSKGFLELLFPESRFSRSRATEQNNERRRKDSRHDRRLFKVSRAGVKHRRRQRRSSSIDWTSPLLDTLSSEIRIATQMSELFRQQSLMLFSSYQQSRGVNYDAQQPSSSSSSSTDPNFVCSNPVDSAAISSMLNFNSPLFNPLNITSTPPQQMSQFGQFNLPSHNENSYSSSTLNADELMSFLSKRT